MSDGSQRPPLPSRRMVVGGGVLVSLATVGGSAPVAVRLDDFLDPAQRAAADRAAPVDCTAAFARALTGGKRVMVPPGHYGLDALRLPDGGGLIGAGGVVIHQMAANRPAVACISDQASGQLAGIVVDGVELVGHPTGRAALVRLEARGGYAIWRSRFAFFARTAHRALEVEAADANNVFECDIAVVSEGTRDTAVLVRGGVYNTYRLFLTQTRGWALDDQSDASDIRVVAENAVIFRGQNNQVTAQVEGIAAPRAADRTAITDRGFGNTFCNAVVNMPASDAGKLDYAFRAFERSVLINLQIIGEGAPPHPFAPTSNAPFTVIGGRSRCRHRVEAIFSGSDPDHDRRNITFVGDVRDFTDLATHPGTTVVQRVSPVGDGVIRIQATTQLLIVDGAQPIGRLALLPGSLRPLDGWRLELASTVSVARLDWPPDGRFEGLPQRLSPGQRIVLVYQAEPDRWFAL